jgi:hypothetical protein
LRRLAGEEAVTAAADSLAAPPPTSISEPPTPPSSASLPAGVTLTVVGDGELPAEPAQTPDTR